MIQLQPRRLGLAFCTNVIPVEDLETGMEKLSQWGYDAVEFWPAAFDRYSCNDLVAMLSRTQLNCAQLSPSFDLTTGKAQLDGSLSNAVIWVERAAKLGCSLVRLLTGRVGVERVSPEGWRMAVGAIRQMCDAAAPYGVTFALETVRDSLAETSLSALRLLEEVDRENLKLNLQLPLKGEDLWDSLRGLSKFAVHMHVHNWQVAPRPEVPRNLVTTQITFLDAGVIDYRRFLREALESGFEGYMSVEHGTHHGRHVWTDTALRDGRYMRYLINDLVAEGEARAMARPV